MRMWRPEKAAHGPLQVTEADVPALNRLFADAFTDRYRRDGLVGVRVPFLNEAVWRYAIQDAGGGAMAWKDESDRLVAFNIAHLSGTEGWMGPLCVRPDRQLAGLGKDIVMAAVEWLKERGARTIGLETMPRTVDNIGFYSHLGFVPGHVTLTLTVETGPRGRRDLELITLGRLADSARKQRLAEISSLTSAMAPGYDFRREIDLTLDLDLGDVVLADRDGKLVGFALCHSVPLAEGSARDEVRALKLVACDETAFLQLIELCTAWGNRLAARRFALRCQTAYEDAYGLLIHRGFRVRWSDLRMHLAGYPEQRPDTGLIWSNWEI